MDDLMGKLQSVLSDEESMKQIRELAAMFENGASDVNQQGSSSFSEQGASANPLGDIDIGKLMQLKGMFDQTKKPDESTTLLLSLRPLLKEESQVKIDRVIKIFRILALWPLIKDSGLLGGDLLGIL